MKTTNYEQTGFANMSAPAVLRLSVLTSLSIPCNLDGSSHSLDRTTGDEKRHRGGSGPSLELPPPLFPIDNHYRDRDGSCRARWKIWIGNGLMNNLESFEMFKFHKDVKAHIRGQDNEDPLITFHEEMTCERMQKGAQSDCKSVFLLRNS